VCCDQRFWRQGNVEIVCKRYKIPYVSSFKRLVPALKVMMEKKGLELDANGDFRGELKEEEKKSKEAPGGHPWRFDFEF
jgi:hypothetical protein